MAKKKDLLKQAQPKGRPGQSELARKLLEKQLTAEEEPDPKPIRLNVNLHPDLYKRFKHKCQQEDRAISDVVRELVETYLSV